MACRRSGVRIPLAPQHFSNACPAHKCLTKCLRAYGFPRLLACVVRSAVRVAEHAVHDGGAAADGGHDHVPVDGLGHVGGLWPTVSLISWSGTPLLLMI